MTLFNTLLEFQVVGTWIFFPLWFIQFAYSFKVEYLFTVPKNAFLKSLNMKVAYLHNEALQYVVLITDQLLIIGPVELYMDRLKMDF